MRQSRLPAALFKRDQHGNFDSPLPVFFAYRGICQWRDHQGRLGLESVSASQVEFVAPGNSDINTSIIAELGNV